MIKVLKRTLCAQQWSSFSISPTTSVERAQGTVYHGVLATDMPIGFQVLKGGCNIVIEVKSSCMETSPQCKQLGCQCKAHSWQKSNGSPFKQMHTVEEVAYGCTSTFGVLWLQNLAHTNWWRPRALQALGLTTQIARRWCSHQQIPIADLMRAVRAVCNPTNNRHTTDP